MAFYTYDRGDVFRIRDNKPTKTLYVSYARTPEIAIPYTHFFVGYGEEEEGDGGERPVAALIKIDETRMALKYELEPYKTSKNIYIFIGSSIICFGIDNHIQEFSSCLKYDTLNAFARTDSHILQFTITNKIIQCPIEQIHITKKYALDAKDILEQIDSKYVECEKLESISLYRIDQTQFDRSIQTIRYKNAPIPKEQAKKLHTYLETVEPNSHLYRLPANLIPTITEYVHGVKYQNYRGGKTSCRKRKQRRQTRKLSSSKSYKRSLEQL